MTNEQTAAYIMSLIDLAVELKYDVYNAAKNGTEDEDALMRINKPVENFVRKLEKQYHALTGQWP